MKKIISIFVAAMTILSCNPIYKKMNIDETLYNSLPEGVYAKMETTQGDMIIQFFDKESPVTVANFVGLAQGTIENKAKAKGTPYYDGIIFHRVIKDFMIQGGDPTGTGMGDPGYKFDDEKNNLKHEGKGYLSMANSGPNTNGSQFFITHVPTPHLDGRHTVFGKVIKGLEVIDAIANVEKGAQDKPKTDVVIKSVKIFTKGDAYKNYDASKIFNEGKGKIRDNNVSFTAKQEEEAKKRLEDLKKTMQTTPSGLHYKITKQGTGKQPKAGDMVAVHYAGRLMNGQEFDNSFKRGQPIEFTVGVGQVIKGWDEGIMLLNEGSSATLMIPSELGYGARGAGGVIPPNATLIFDVELVKVK
jgi:FKBP-type peptidyl-prolyl cis-trans isomerase